jgi:hypothetical protein
MSQTETGTQTDVTMHAKPQKEHEWLKQLLGEWTYETAEPVEGEKATGSETVRSLGDLWILAEGRSRMPDGSLATTLMSIGFDPARRRFVGSWMGSMMSHLWIYDGELDGTGKILTLNSEGPSMTGDGTTGKYQDRIELKSNDHRVLTARTLGADGTWQEFMTVHYHRKK